jgi:hypothetical protein
LLHLLIIILFLLEENNLLLNIKICKLRRYDVHLGKMVYSINQLFII